jgi:hypothetical protein
MDKTPEEIIAEARAANSSKAPRSKKNQQTEAAINTDLTADYQAGQQLADAKLQAFHRGFTDRMSQAQQFLNTQFNTGSFAIASADYTRALPSQESVSDSFMTLLYSEEVA